MTFERSIVSLMLFASACVIDAQDIRTRLVQVCSDDLPLTLVAQSSDVVAATLQVEGIDALGDHPEARVSLRSMTIEVASGDQNFSFAEALSLEVIAPDTGLPPVRVAEASSQQGESPWTASGDGSIDLAEYFRSETLEMRLEITGHAPTDPLSVLFGACLAIEGIEIMDGT